MKQIPLNEATEYLRELLTMNRTELLRQAKFAHNTGRMNNDEFRLFLFERQFDATTKDPTIAMHQAKMKKDPFTNRKRPLNHVVK